MSKAVDHLDSELQKIRAGAATPSMLESVRVDYYGQMVPLSQVASVNTGDARTLFVKPWEKKTDRCHREGHHRSQPRIQSEQQWRKRDHPRAHAHRGSPESPLQERRTPRENTPRVGIRSSRQKAMDAIKAAKKDGLPEDAAKGLEVTWRSSPGSYNKKVEALIDAKEKDIMKV
jgi:ribosome recycling factor